MDFRSDNVTGAHPRILEALAQANHGAESAYGDDSHSAALTARLSVLFEREVAVFPVVTGTAANALALALYTPPWGAIYAEAAAHIHVSECGAPEFYTAGAKLVQVSSSLPQAGKLAPADVERAIHREGAVHAVQPAVVSVSQASEAGTLYTAAEVGALAEACARHRMALHVDGARFANALAALGASPAELTWRAGVDVLALGGSKNGCLMAEAVVLFDRGRAAEFAFRRKRAGHLVSKLRFVSAQLNAYFEGDLWLKNAAHANTQAARLGDGLRLLGIPLAAPVQTNQVFARLSAERAARLRERGAAFYDWPTLGADVRRLVTAFDTDPAAVDAFLAAVSSQMD